MDLDPHQGPLGSGSFLDVRVMPESKVYFYNVQIAHRPAFDRDLIDPMLRAGFWEAHRAVVGSIFSAQRNFGNAGDNRFRCLYDGDSRLYTNLPLDLPQDPDDGERKAIYLLRAGAPDEDMITPPLIRNQPGESPAVPELPDDVRSCFGTTEMLATIAAAGETDLYSDIPEAISADGQDYDKRHRAFLFWLMAETVAHSMSNYDCYPVDNKIFVNYPVEMKVDSAFTLRSIVSLEPRISGTPDTVSISIAANLVVGAFYTPQRLEQALEAYRTTEDNFDYDSFSKQFRGVRCHLRDDETLSVVIQGVTEKPIRDIREVNDDGEESRYSLADFFRSRFLDLKDHLRAVRVSNHFPNNIIAENFYPFEALIIVPRQRVPLPRMSDALAEHVIRANCDSKRTPREIILHDFLKKAIFECDAASRNLDMFGLSLAMQHNRFSIVDLGRMSVIYGANGRIPLENADWTQEAATLKYIQPSTVTKLSFIYDRRLPTANELGALYNSLCTAAERKGVRILAREYLGVNGIQDLFADGAVNHLKGTSIVVYVNQKGRNSHGKLKLWERLFDTATVHIPVDTAPNMHPSYLAKLAAKVNTKTAGLCYKPNFGELLDGPVFIMGLAFTTTQPDTVMQRKALNRAPSAVAVRDRHAGPFVLGVCANQNRDQCGNLSNYMFSGDYDFQARQNDGIIEPDVLTDVTDWAFKRFVGDKRNYLAPAIVFRYCDSESSFASILANELDPIRKGFRSGGKMKPKMALILVTNGHAKDFWPKNWTTTVPGSVVHNGIYKGEQCEIFMQPFRFPSKEGSTRYIQYLIAHNSTEFTVAQLRDIAYGLCYSRQTQAHPTSLPEPVHRALQLGTRGRSNLEEYRKLGDSTPWLAGWLARKGIAYDANNLDQARGQLCHRRRTALANRCFTA